MKANTPVVNLRTRRRTSYPFDRVFTNSGGRSEGDPRDGAQNGGKQSIKKDDLENKPKCLFGGGALAAKIADFGFSQGSFLST